MEEVRREEQQLLEAQSTPLRNYLMQNVLPTITLALIDCCRVRPDDPIDFLVRHHSANSPHHLPCLPGRAHNHHSHLLTDLRRLLCTVPYLFPACVIMFIFVRFNELPKVQFRDVKVSRTMWPRGQIIHPQLHSFWPRPHGIWLHRNWP